MEVDEGEEGTVTPIIPTMYRWISTSRVTTSTDGMQEKEESRMLLSFSVPIHALPQQAAAVADGTPVRDAGGVPPTTKAKPLCDIEGCEAQRKYRLVKDWERGACGLAHLKTLETQLLSA